MAEQGNEMPFAVCGLHMRSRPLNHQLTDLGASFGRTVKTAPEYRMFQLPHTGGMYKPGLVRVASGGGSIQLEIWYLPLQNVGAFLKNVPSPLAVGSILLMDGTCVLGFICEAFILDQAPEPQDITNLGHFPPYLQNSTPSAEHLHFCRS